MPRSFSNYCCASVFCASFFALVFSDSPNIFAAEPEYCNSFHSYACQDEMSDEQFYKSIDLEEKLKVAKEKTLIEAKRLLSQKRPLSVAQEEVTAHVDWVYKQFVPPLLDSNARTFQLLTSQSKTISIQLLEYFDKILKEEISKKYDLKIKPETIATTRLLLREVIAGLPIRTHHKKSLQEVLDDTEVSNEQCFKKKLFGFTLAIRSAGMDLSDAEDSFRKEVTVCSRYLLESKNELSLVWLLAHELSHSIDPCEVDKKNKADYYRIRRRSVSDAQSFYNVPNLLSCLRNKESIEANTDDHFFKIEKRREELFSYPKNQAIVPPRAILCTEQDQIGESVADWFAAEVVAKYIDTKLKNLTALERAEQLKMAIRPICLRKGEFEKVKKITHPFIADRIDRLLMVHPKIRNALGCHSSSLAAGYCDGKNPNPTKQEALPSPASGTPGSIIR